MKNKTVFIKIKNSVKKLNIMVLVLTGLFLSSSTFAVNIATKPLFLNQSTPPNIMFILDDSGSMDFDILTVPHWSAQNYDHDVMRYWAQGGWVGWSDRPTSKITDATWRSYTGYCQDRNADGICYNELYLNDDNDRGDSERTVIAPVVANNDWGLVLEHWYFWEYPKGYCSMPSGAPDLPDAGDWLPSLDKVFAFITGSKQAYAHSGDFGPGNPHQWKGVNDASTQDTGGGAYRQEVWKNKGPDRNTWDVDNEYYNNAADKTTCEGNGGTWKRGNNYNDRVLHHGSYTFGGVTTNAGWINDWTGPAPVINPLTGAITANGPLNSNTGDYHNEYLKNYTTATAGRDRFDINGDGVGNDGSFRENDAQDNRVVNYRYIQHLTDNTYPKADWNACGNTSDTKYYMATNACPPLNDYMPGNYPVASPNLPDDNPSNKVAKDHDRDSPGKKDFVQLGNSSAKVPRYIRSGDWVGNNGILPRRTPNVDVLMPPWAAGTKHAMSKHDPFPLVVDWRVRSADFNVMYYSPDSKYSVWSGFEVGEANEEVLPTTCPTTNKFNCARSNPQPGTAGYNILENLARPRAEYGAEGIAPVNVQAGFVYEVWVDDAGYFGSRPEWKRGNSKCGSAIDGSYTLPAATVDPATGLTIAAGEKVCFTYSDSSNGEVDLWDSHYRVEVRDTDILVQKVRRTPHLKGKPLYTDSVYDRSSEHYWDDNNKAGANGTGSTVFTNIELNNMRVAMSETRVLGTWDTAAIYADTALCIKLLGRDKSNKAACRPLAQIQENAANWYQYSRKRSFVAKGAIASLIAEIPDVNYGLMGTKQHNTDNISALFKDIYDGTGSGNGDAIRTDHNDDIRSALYSYVWPATGTPLRRALERAGEYFAGRGPNLGPGVDNHSESPIKESCQKNFAIMLTDGYWNGDDPLLTVGDEDIDTFGAAYNGTLADVAKKYYDEDLRPSMDDDVLTDIFNTNNKQHLTTIGVGFGVSGSLVDQPNNSSIPKDGWPGDPDASGASTWTETSTWGGDPKPNSNAAFKIDDLWHAAYNSRGLYLSANNPEELLNSLKTAILFALQETGSASSLTINNDFTSTGTRVYQTIFRSGEWTGDVRSLQRDASGVFASVVWSAQSQLTSVGHSSRNIFTLDASGATAVPFRFASLSVPQQDAMKVRQITGVSDLDGDKHVDYIRGDSTNEGTLFRERAGNKLGDIVHSAVLRVDVPNASYPDNWGTGQPENGAAYSSFKAVHNPPTPGIPRPVMLFVGANDGMLHAFDAATGDEKYAYIPSVLIPKLNYLSHLPSSATPFNHQFYVDDTPVSRDAFFGGAWHTVLVGGLRGGGKAIYALDISTVPSVSGTEASIGNAKHLWEFTDTNPTPYGDSDLGFTFSRPQIVRLANGKWAAIFGNGYQDDATGKAILYIVDLADGSLIKKIVADGADVGNGLSSPTAVDVNDDYIADFVYAGDLKGNLWRFDLRDPLPANWHVSFAGSPLFVAHETGLPLSKQPITVAPTVEIHPRGSLAGSLVSFGTGKYLELTDNNIVGEKTQSLYTIWDYDSGNVNRADLLVQNVVFQAPPPFGSRATSANGVNWMDAGHNIGEPSWESYIDNTGWYIDLTFTAGNEGERQVNKALIFGKYLTFDSLIPNSEACSAGGGSRRYILDRESGANFLGEPLDLNGDGIIDAAEAAAFMNAIYTEGYSYDDGNAQVPDLITGEFETIIDKSTAVPITGSLPIISKGERRSWIQLD